MIVFICYLHRAEITCCLRFLGLYCFQKNLHLATLFTYYTAGRESCLNFLRNSWGLHYSRLMLNSFLFHTQWGTPQQERQLAAFRSSFKVSLVSALKAPRLSQRLITRVL